VPSDASAAEAQSLLARALSGGKATWKVFAPRPLTPSELDELFDQREVDSGGGGGEAARGAFLDWYAYPHYVSPQPLRPFVLSDDGSLLYLNAIEQVASAMEMSAIAARNAANILVQLVEARRGQEGGNGL
jgi:hypothetical protein